MGTSPPLDVEAFYLYSVIGSAALVGMASLALLRRYHLKTISDEEIHLSDK